MCDKPEIHLPPSSTCEQYSLTRLLNNYGCSAKKRACRLKTPHMPQNHPSLVINLPIRVL